MSAECYLGILAYTGTYMFPCFRGQIVYGLGYILTACTEYFLLPSSVGTGGGFCVGCCCVVSTGEYFMYTAYFSTFGAVKSRNSHALFDTTVGY